MNILKTILKILLKLILQRILGALSWLGMIAMRIFLGPNPYRRLRRYRFGVIPDSLLDHEGKLIHPELQYPAQ